MRVSGINNIVSFGKNMRMVIPTDIDKMIKTSSGNNYSPAFGGMGFKPIAVPICDTFVHVFK